MEELDAHGRISFVAKTSELYQVSKGRLEGAL